MPHRSKQDFARLTDEALGTIMAPFPSWGSAKEGPGPKYFYKSLLLICSSLLSRQMCAASARRPTYTKARRALLRIFRYGCMLYTYIHACMRVPKARVRLSRARERNQRCIYILRACATTMLAMGASGTRTGVVTGGQLVSPRGAVERTSKPTATVTRHRRGEYRGHRRGRATSRQSARSAVVGRHHETKIRWGIPARARKREEAAAIIFHRQKRKGRMPFISPGSVGSHVVGAVACDTSITDQPACCTADGGDGIRIGYTLSTWTSYTRLSRAPRIPVYNRYICGHCAPILIFLLLLD